MKKTTLSSRLSVLGIGGIVVLALAAFAAAGTSKSQDRVTFKQIAEARSTVVGAPSNKTTAKSAEPSAAEMLAAFRQVYALDLTRFFAEKYGLDPEAELPVPLAELYNSWLNEEIGTEEYITSLQRLIDRKPSWLAD